MSKHSSFWLFLIGLGSVTQFHFVGSLGLSEFPMFLLSPFVFIVDYKALKADGFLPFVWLSILTCVGCVLSSVINHTPIIFFAKGLAHPYAIFSASVIFHKLLRRNFGGLKWFLVGAVISGFISIFIFQPETFTVHGEYRAEGAAATESVMGYALFWSGKVRSVLTLPVSAFYLSVPTGYSVLANLVTIPIMMIFSRGSGRAAALTIMLGTILIFIGRRSRKRMELIGRHIILLSFLGVAALYVFKTTYAYVAKEGYLGYDAQEKYLRQTKTGTSTLKLLMAGRMELFCGVMACLDRPIFGFGPKGEDTEGYTERFLRDYGAQEDYEHYIQWECNAMKQGRVFYRAIPVHSYIAMFWVGYGIIGLILWLYVLWLFYKYLRSYAPAIPQFYGYVCLGIAGQLWDIFFSPFAARFQIPLLVACILFCKAVKEGRMQLPQDMEMEARRYE